MNKPNFFILGAGKCGTTSLHNYLSQHPEVFMPSGIDKEPVFFNKGFQVVKNPVDYFNLFSGVTTEKRIGEASHAYLTSPESSELLKLLFPDAKFIIILRNPVDRAYSLYVHMRKMGFEKSSSFERALSLEGERFNSAQFTKECPEYFYNFMYYRSGLFGEQIERYYSLFSSDQFYVTTLGSLQADAEGEIAKIYRFLDVDEGFNPNFKMHNKGGIESRFQSLNLPRIRRLRKLIPIQRTGLNFINQFLIKSVPPMIETTRQELSCKYASDLEKVYDLTGLRLD